MRLRFSAGAGNGQPITTPLVSIVNRRKSSSFPVRIFPAHGPYLLVSLGSVSTHSSCRPMLASLFDWPREVTRIKVQGDDEEVAGRVIINPNRQIKIGNHRREHRLVAV